MRTQQEVRHLGRYAIFYKRFFEQFRARPVMQSQADIAAQQAKKLTEVVSNAQDTLIEVSSIFPFMLFPDSLKVTRQKVVLTHRSFFGVAQIINIQIGDLQAIEADVGPLFGTVSITTRQFSNTVNKIHYLSRKDAVDAQGLLQGFVIANKKKLDFSNIEKRQLIDLLHRLGRGEA